MPATLQVVLDYTAVLKTKKCSPNNATPAVWRNKRELQMINIDDLCVDETLRGKHIGKELYELAVKLAKDTGCYNLTLNVWSCNQSALKFYESLGLLPQKIGMELILK